MPIEVGELGAVGLALEEIYGKAPITATQLGKTTAPARFFGADPDGGIGTMLKMNIPYNQVDGDGELSKSILEAKDHAGGYSHQADAENMIYPLLGIFGKCVQTALGVPSGGVPVFKHVFTYNREQPSFSVEHKYSSGAAGRLDTGYVFNMLDLIFASTMQSKWGGIAAHAMPNNYKKLDYSNAFFNWTDVAANLPWQMAAGSEVISAKVTTTPTLIDVYPATNGNGPFTWNSMRPGSIAGYDTGDATTSGIIKIDDVLKVYNPTNFAGLKLEEGFAVNLARDTESHHVGRSGEEMGAIAASTLKVGGNAEFLYEDATIVQAALAHGKIGINFKLVGEPIPGNTPQFYSFEVHIPRARFTSANPTMPAGSMKQPGDFCAEKDKVLGYSIQITTVDTFDMSTLGGIVADLPGGLGGWKRT